MYDVTLNIIADPCVGRWAWESSNFPYLSKFACGHIQTLSLVELLTFGVVAALKSISAANIAKYLSGYMAEHSSYLDARQNGRKLWIKVRTVDENFRSLLNGSGDSMVPATLLAELKKEKARFHVEGKRAQMEDMQKLQGWSKMVLPSRQFTDGFPRPDEQRTA